MTETSEKPIQNPQKGKPRGKNGGRKPKGETRLATGIYLGLTDRQADYLGCAAIKEIYIGLDQQDIVRMALDKWIDDETWKEKSEKQKAPTE